MSAYVTITHVITGLGLGGAEQMLYKLLSLTDREQFPQRVVSLTDAGVLGGPIRELGVPVHVLGMRRGVPEPAAVVRLARLLRDQTTPHVVQTWMPHADLLGTLALKLSRRRARLAWNVRCGTIDFSKYRSTTRWTVSALAHLSSVPDLLISNSEAGCVVHERLGYSPRRWAIIPNGFDLARYKPDPSRRTPFRIALGVPVDAFLIAQVARFDPMKDHTTALNALRRCPNVHLVAVGSGMDRANRALRLEGLDGRIHLLGQRPDVPELLAACDIATLSSSFGEGFPNVLGEAMACGLPCVATDVGDAAHIIAHTGVCVPPGNPAALAAGWKRMVDAGTARRQELGRAARLRVEKNWSLPTIVRAYEREYALLARSDPDRSDEPEDKPRPTSTESAHEYPSAAWTNTRRPQ